MTDRRGESRARVRGTPRPRSRDAKGYANAEYARSLAEFGRPRHLPRSDGWILERRIGDTPLLDAMGPYPVFCCADWSVLADDVAQLAGELVSVTLVTDPFGEVDPATLHAGFDRVVRFKDHYVAELDRPPEQFVATSHRRGARRALRAVDVAVCEHPADHLEIWLELFANLSRRHAITGLRAYSRQAFEAQLRIPGLVMFQASVGDEVVGLDLWYQQGEVAYGHVAAFSDVGYQLRASYATKWTMLRYFYERVRWVDLTGTAGASDDHDSGLAQFKAGWSTETKPVYLCGRILQPARYEDLTRQRGARETNYFPAYRQGELA